MLFNEIGNTNSAFAAIDRLIVLENICWKSLHSETMPGNHIFNKHIYMASKLLMLLKKIAQNPKQRFIRPKSTNTHTEAICFVMRSMVTKDPG